MQNDSYYNYFNEDVNFTEVTDGFLDDIRNVGFSDSIVSFLCKLPAESMYYGAAFLGDESWICTWKDEAWRNGIIPIACGHCGNAICLMETEDREIIIFYTENMALGEKVTETKKYYFETKGKELFDGLYSFEIDLFS